MRLTILVLVVLAIFFVALALAPAANARAQGWYLGLGAGWNSLGSVNYALAAPAGPQLSKVDFGDSGEFGTSVGYRPANPGVKHINSALISLRWYVASASSVPGPKLGTSALSQPSQLNRRFAQFINFDDSRLDEAVTGFEEVPMFVTREAWEPCNRRVAIDLGS
jgi:hypothetical protein